MAKLSGLRNMDDLKGEGIDTDNSNNNGNNLGNIINNILYSDSVTTKKKQVGIYFEPDIARILSQLSKKKGDQSKIVNDILRQAFKEGGYL